MLYFEWDPAKAAANLEKHGISFAAAAAALEDPYAIEEEDQVVEREIRLRTIGMADGEIIVTVTHTNRPNDPDDTEIARIISARRATKSERRRYDELRSQSGWNPAH